MADELELFDAWAAGDARAGSELFDLHARSVLLFFRSKVGDEAAEDLVQETFLACLKARESFRKQASFRTYLFRAARSRLINFVTRDRPKRDRIDFGVTSMTDLGISPSVAIAKAETEHLLLQALQGLPLDLQIAIELHYFQRFTTAELGEILEIPTGTARSRLRRARELLQTSMTELSRRPVGEADALGSLQSWAASLRPSAPLPGGSDGPDDG